jgi:hypothetical protein
LNFKHISKNVYTDLFVNNELKNNTA